MGRERIKFGLIAGAIIGGTGGLGASAVGAVAAGGASGASIAVTTLGVGAVEGVVGQVTLDLLTQGHLSDSAGTYASAAVSGGVTAGAGYAAGAAWRGARATWDVLSYPTGEALEHGGRRVVAIGEDMQGRVRPFAQQVGADVYKPRVTDRTKMLEDNRQWIHEKMDEGCIILDCGPAPGRPGYPKPTSPFYKMELDEIEARKYSHYRRVR